MLISNAHKSPCVQHVHNVIMAYFVLLVPKKIMCVNFENTCALNSPIFSSVVKKWLDDFSWLIFIRIGLTVQTVEMLLREINLATH